MKKITKYFSTNSLILFIGIMFIGCEQSMDVSNQIKEVNKAFMEAFNKGDVQGVVMNYTNQAKLFPANSDAIEGQSAIETYWKDAMQMGVAKAELVTVSAEAIGNMAVEDGKYKLFTKDGQMIDQGKYVVNWVKVDGVWKINRDIWNTSEPGNPIIGSWNLIEVSGSKDGSDYHYFTEEHGDEQIKVWTNSHFAFIGTGHDSNGKKIDFYGGGTYTLDGNQYTEHVLYNNNKSMEGSTVRMLLEMRGDTLIQTFPVDANGAIDTKNFNIEKYLRLD